MNDKDLVLAAANLARAAPERWKNFMDALAAYTEDKGIECIQSPIDMLQVAQGRAQGLAALGRLLDGCLRICREHR